MRKIYYTLTLLLLSAITCQALPNAAVLLQHEGFVTVYSQDDLDEALSNSVDGDTIFLSKGTYPGFTIDKQITVRGEGDRETVITGLITVAIPDSVSLKSSILEGLSFNGYSIAGNDNYSIRVTTPLDGFKIKQCYFESLVFDRTQTNVVIDKCYCSKYISVPQYVMSLQAVNSKFYAVDFKHPSDYYSSNSSKEITFINCNVRTFHDFENFKGSLINSISGYGRSGSEVSLSGCSIINSLVSTYRLTIKTSCYRENCWTVESTKVLSDNMSCMYSNNELIENGYIGNDGTVIGCFGGMTPYTLTLNVPVVTDAEVKLDAIEKRLDVKLTVGVK